jgi:ribosome-associated protein
VNKVSTKATLRWSPRKSSALSDAVRNRFERRYGRRLTQAGEIIIISQRFRDRGRNVADCLSKLRDMLLSVADEPTVRRKTRPTAASTRRRKRDKQSTSRKKQLRQPPRSDE